MDVASRVARWLAHTRFVPTPVYRLMVLSWLVGGLLSLIFGPPFNVASQLDAEPQWFMWAYVALQIAASALTLSGLYLVEENIAQPEKLHRSLTMELVGIIFLETCIAIQVTATFFSQPSFPTSGLVWMGIVFGLWILARVRDILRAIRRLTR